MAKTVLIETLNTRKNQIGVKYLIEDTDTSVVKRADVLIGADENPAVYGEQYADDLFASGDVVSGGERIFEGLREETIKDLHEQAIFQVKATLKAGGDLEDILDAMVAVYTDAGQTRITGLLTDFYQTWNAGTAGQKNQFIIFMLFLLTVRSK